MYHYSSTTAYVIGRYQKHGKQKRKLLENTTDHSSAPSTPSNSYKKLNENTDITSKKSLTAEIHYSKTFSIYDKPSEIIQTEPLSYPYTKHMLILNIYVNDDAQFFETLRENNYSVAAPRAHIMLVYYDDW